MICYPQTTFQTSSEKVAKWETKHQPTPTLDPRKEFAAVLREIGAVVQGEHPIMNGEVQRIPATNDKRGGPSTQVVPRLILNRF